MLLKKCSENHYSISDSCPICNNKTKTAHPAKFAMR